MGWLRNMWRLNELERRVAALESVRAANRLVTLERKSAAMEMTQAELAAELKKVKETNGKIFGEITSKIASLQTKIDELEAAINAGGNVTQEVQDALQGVKDSQKQLDDVVPDAE